MAGSLNKVMLIGNLGQDPDVRTLQSGSKVCNLSIATSESWKDKQTGERKERTEWHRVVVYNEGIANVCENYLRKGSKVFVEGQLETRKWQDQSGKDNYTTEVVLRPFTGNLTMLDSRNSGGQQMGGGYQQQQVANNGGGYQQAPQQMQQQGNAAPAQVHDDFEDDIPF